MSRQDIGWIDPEIRFSNLTLTELLAVGQYESMTRGELIALCSNMSMRFESRLASLEYIVESLEHYSIEIRGML